MRGSHVPSFYGLFLLLVFGLWATGHLPLAWLIFAALPLIILLVMLMMAAGLGLIAVVMGGNKRK